MPLLTEVQETDSGYVGITESNEKVKLSKPVLEICVLDNPPISKEETEESCKRWVDNVVKNSILPKAGDDIYIQVGPSKMHLYNSGTSFCYAKYEKRE